MAQLFVSFSPSDRQSTERIVTRLQRAGHQVITDPGQTPLGVVMQQIAASDAFLYILSPASVNSPACKTAFEEAQRQHKAIIPININARTPVIPALTAYHVIDLQSGLNDQNAPQFIRTINRMLGGGAQTSFVGKLVELFMVALVVAAVLLASYLLLRHDDKSSTDTDETALVLARTSTSLAIEQNATFVAAQQTLDAAISTPEPTLDEPTEAPSETPSATPDASADDPIANLTATFSVLQQTLDAAGLGNTQAPDDLSSNLTATFAVLQQTLDASNFSTSTIEPTLSPTPEIDLTATFAFEQAVQETVAAASGLFLTATAEAFQPTPESSPTLDPNALVLTIQALEATASAVSIPSTPVEATPAPSATPELLPTHTAEVLPSPTFTSLPPSATPSPTQEPPTPTPSPSPTIEATPPPQLDLLLTYNADSFVIQNIRGENLDITGLEFVLPDDSDHFDTLHIGAQTISNFSAGLCVQVVINNRSATAPDDCQNLRVRSFGRKSQFSFYWVWDAETSTFPTFNVTRDDVLIAVCEVVAGSCAVSLTGDTLAPVPAIMDSTLPQNYEIAFVSERDGNPEIYVLDPASLDVLRLTDSAGIDRMPAWSPDGSAIAFVSERDGNPEIYVMASDGSNLTRITDNPSDDLHPTWSPDGSTVAFQSNRDGDWNIYTTAIDRSSFRQLVSHPAADEAPDWSPLKDQILIMTDRHGDTEIYALLMTETSVTTERLTNSAAAHQFPVWSPNARQIAFESDRDGNPEIYTVEIDSSFNVSRLQRLTVNAARDGDPTWGRGGIAFVSNRDGNLNIYAIDTNGGNERRLTAGNTDYDPNWRR